MSEEAAAYEKSHADLVQLLNSKKVMTTDRDPYDVARKIVEVLYGDKPSDEKFMKERTIFFNELRDKFDRFSSVPPESFGCAWVPLFGEIVYDIGEKYSVDVYKQIKAIYMA